MERRGRQERRNEQKCKREQLQVEEVCSWTVPKVSTGTSSEELKILILQATNSTIGAVRSAVKEHESTGGIGLFYKEGLLFRRWIPPGQDKEDMMVEQLVLPTKC